MFLNRGNVFLWKKKKIKKKHTLTVSIKKPVSVSHYSQNRHKTSVVIEKKISRKRNDRRFYSQDNNISKSKSGFVDEKKSKKNDSFIAKNTTINRNFEIRKMAEERATKVFKDPKEDSSIPKKGNLG